MKNGNWRQKLFPTRSAYQWVSRLFQRSLNEKIIIVSKINKKKNKRQVNFRVVGVFVGDGTAKWGR